MAADARAAAAAACGGDAPFAAARGLLERAVRAAVRGGVEPADVAPALAGAGVADAVARDVAGAVRARRDALAAALAAAAPGHASLTRMRWRVDVAISSSSLNKVMRPCLLAEWSLSDGRMVTAEVPVERFHELRYATAKVLAEMGGVEGHPVLRIA